MKAMRFGLFFFVFLLILPLLYLYADLPVARYFRSVQSHDLVKIFKWVTILGESQWYLIPSFFLFFHYRKKKDAWAEQSLFLFSSVALSGIIVLVLKMIFGRCRPRLFFRYDLYGFDFFRLDADYLSFPSGHSATALSLTVSLAILFPRFRLVFLLSGVLIALSRVIVTAHYISDILAGSLIGVLTAMLLYTRVFKDRIKAF